MFCIFFFNDRATTEIYTLSLHDALPICDTRSPLRRPRGRRSNARRAAPKERACGRRHEAAAAAAPRSEEHTSELQSRQYLVCRLLLEKKNIQILSPNYRHVLSICARRAF